MHVTNILNIKMYLNYNKLRIIPYDHLSQALHFHQVQMHPVHS